MSGYGGIGRHARFRFLCRKVYRFKSCYPHQTRIIRTLYSKLEKGSDFSLCLHNKVLRFCPNFNSVTKSWGSYFLWKIGHLINIFYWRSDYDTKQFWKERRNLHTGWWLSYSRFDFTARRAEHSHRRMGVRVSGGHLCQRQKHRPNRQARLRHKRYLMENQRVTFNIMQMNGTLWKYLADIDKQAEDMFLRFVNDMAKAECVTEQLKAEDQMLWVRKRKRLYPNSLRTW